MGRIFIISAPSGTGKTTICKKVLDKINGLVRSVSYTTRLCRKGEKEGVDYYYVTKKEFEKMIEKNEFLEWANVYGNLYGTKRESIEKILNSGKDALLTIDVQGAMAIKKIFPESILIFLSPPSLKELEKRIKKRKLDTEEETERRLEKAKEELKFIKKYDYNIVNSRINETVKAIIEIINKYRDEK